MTSLNNFFFKTTECVGPGHPDKVADLIADSVLDSCLNIDSHAKVACEVMVKDDIVVLGGEITLTGNSKPNFESIVKSAVKTLGYTKPELLFCCSKLKFLNFISQQSPEINKAVVGTDESDVGAGDQGIMWGYATNETPTFMPIGMYLARGAVEALEPLKWDKLFADCKTQVTLEYTQGKSFPNRVSHIVVSVMHDKEMSLEQVQTLVKQRLSKNLISKLPKNLAELFNKETKYIINHAGTWTIGGPAADCGVVGRKIVVDAYGADCEVGGGAFSGKDPSKVDRTSAYMARYVAKNIVAAGLADKCKVQVGYVIGQKEPVSLNIDSIGTGKISDREIEKKIKELVSFTPGSIIQRFNMRQPIYAETALKGHFGVSYYLWEQLDLVDKLRL